MLDVHYLIFQFANQLTYLSCLAAPEYLLVPLCFVKMLDNSAVYGLF